MILNITFYIIMSFDIWIIEMLCGE
jgi:hypothetical protein